MRILIDESVPRGFAEELAGFDVATVRQRGWSQMKNGVLLRAAADAGVDVLITCDSSIPYQQNLNRMRIAVIAFVGVKNRMDDLRPLILQVLDALDTMKPGDAIEIRPARPSNRVYDRPAMAQDRPFQLVTFASAGRLTPADLNCFSKLIEEEDVRKYRRIFKR